MKSLFEQMGGTYSDVGDYILPNLTLPPQKQSFFGKYGMLRKAYLKTQKMLTIVVCAKTIVKIHEFQLLNFI
ncbi:MAG TPA: TnpV protein [Bacillota bacterium]|nr:TnpV protein [Bacillota bacterium]